MPAANNPLGARAKKSAAKIKNAFRPTSSPEANGSESETMIPEQVYQEIASLAYEKFGLDLRRGKRELVGRAKRMCSELHYS